MTKPGETRTITFETIEFYPELKKRASALAEKYGLHEGTSRSLDYFWLGRDFAIIFLLERDGVGVRYVDTPRSTGSHIYFLGHFLTSHRRIAEIKYPAPPQTLTPSVLISAQLDYLLTLLDGSPDILRGERGWLDDYKLERPLTPQNWRAEIDSFRLRVKS